MPGPIERLEEEANANLPGYTLSSQLISDWQEKKEGTFPSSPLEALGAVSEAGWYATPKLGFGDI